VLYHLLLNCLLVPTAVGGEGTARILGVSDICMAPTIPFESHIASQALSQPVLRVLGGYATNFNIGSDVGG
jgi:hypothetical protein